MTFGTSLLAGGILAAAFGAAHLVMYRRLRSHSSERIGSMEAKIGELHKALLEAKLERSQAVRAAEQIPMIVQKLTERLPADAYPPVIVRHAKEITNAGKVGYFVPVAGSDYLVLRVGYGFPDDWHGTMRIARGEGSVGHALRKRVVLAREDFEADVFPGSLPSLEQEGIDPDLVAPVHGIAGVEGVLVIAGCNHPPRSLKVNVSMLVDILSLSIQNATLLESRERAGYHDPVTGLASRFHFMKAFEAEVRRASNYRQPLSLLLFEIDRFGEFGGSAAESAILANVARLAKRCTRSSHFIARYGENRFAALLPSTNREQAFRYAESLRERIAATGLPVDGREEPVRCTISGGISALPGDGGSVAELVRAAGDSLEEARAGGMNRIALSHPAETDIRSTTAEPRREAESIPSLDADSDSA